MTKNSSEMERNVEKLFIGVALFIGLNAKVIWRGLKRVRPLTWKFVSCCWCILLLSYVTVFYKWHLYFLNWLNPDFFDRSLLRKINSFGFWDTTFFLIGLFALIVLWIMGIGKTVKLRRLQNALEDVGLKNAKEAGPKVIDYYLEGPYHAVVKVLAPGIGANGLKNVKEKLEASFEKQIEEIRSSKNPKFAEIVLSKQELPEIVHYSQLTVPIRPYGFIVGESKKGTVVANLTKFPHLLIAGTTGQGKSQFFKQMLLGVVESSDRLQMYLIDLKGGLEMKEFSSLPNVKVVKNIEDAVILLEKIESKMKKRFAFLERSGKEAIDPLRDKMDRIVVGIDEASVLYATGRKDSEDFTKILRARELTENIAKLSRAAAIHLVLATQKVTKETIDTRVQENISVRMCFRLNTIEGSVRVLGNGAANDLPTIPGRGIWQWGVKTIEVQTPYLNTDELKQRVEVVAEKFGNKEKVLNEDMMVVEAEKLSINSAFKNALYKESCSNGHH